MGFFKKLTKRVVKSVTSPAGFTRTVMSGGANLVVPGVDKALKPVSKALWSPQTLAIGAGIATGQPGLGVSAASFLSQKTQGPTGGSAMGFNLGGLLGVIGGVTQQFGGNISNPYVSSVGQLSSAFGSGLTSAQTYRSAFASPGQSMFAQPSAQPMFGSPAPQAQAMTVSNRLPSVRAGSLTQEVFNAGLQVLSRLGIPAPASMGGFSSTLKRALSSIATLARKTPAGTMVSLLMGLGLATYEASLLTIWHAQRRKGRRMNPANSKALRRAARRIRGFHKLCTHTDLLKTRSRSVGRSRCGTCSKSPCRC